MGARGDGAESVETLLLAREWLYATYPDHVITGDGQGNYHIDPTSCTRSSPIDRVILTCVIQNSPEQWIQVRVLLPSAKQWVDPRADSSPSCTTQPYLSLPLSGRKTDLLGQLIQQRRNYEQYGHLALFSD